ncbi:zinc finger, CCHC-type containing protein [Tanacetum coccineum]
MLTACYLLNRVPNKRNKITPYELWTKRKQNRNYLRVWGCRDVVRLPDPMLKTLGERGIECIFVGYAKHSKAFRFYVIGPNESVSINSIIESRYDICDENRFSSVPRPSLTIPNGSGDTGGSVVPEEVTKEVVQQPEPELRKIKRNRTPKNFGLEFQLYLIEGTRDEVSDEHSYCFNIEDDPKTFDEAMKSHDMDVKTAFLNGKLEEEVYMNQPQAFIMPSNENNVCKLIKSLYGLKQTPKQWHQKFDKVVLSNGYLLNQADKYVYSKFDEMVNLTKEFLSSRFSMKDMGETDVILGIRIKHGSNGIEISQSHYIEKVLKKFNYFDYTPVSTSMDTSEKLMPNNGQAVSQLEYSRVIGCLMYAMTCTRPDIAFVVGKLSRYTSNPDTQHWQAIQWDTLMQVGSATEDNSSTSGWVYLLGGVVGKEAECAATLAKAYSQMYNGKSRHLGVRHSMIHELITNGVVSIEFVRSQQNLVDHLTKGLARDLVIKSAEGMGLKSNLVAEC